MKEYKLLSWPDLPAEFRRMGFRRLLSEMSQRHVTEAALFKREGVKRSEVRALLQLLAERNVLEVRQAEPSAGKWKPALAGWLRRLTT
jgi:transcription initiation factor IIE alpha subunit